MKSILTLFFAVLLCSPALVAQVNDTVKVAFNEHAQLEYIFETPKDFEVFKQVNLDSLTLELAENVSKIPENTDTLLVLNDSSERKKTESLELSAAIGGSLVRHKLVPYYGLRIGVSFGSREPKIIKTNNDGIDMTIYAEYQHMTFFERNGEQGYSAFGNGFVSLGFVARQSETGGMGLNIGYLVNQNGNYFGENTMKLELYTSTKKSISLSPFIIATDNFKSFFPGVRIGFL